MDHEPHSYIKNELSRIFLEDLYDGSRRTGFFAKKADVTEFLDSWLDKYKSQEELQKLLKADPVMTDQQKRGRVY